jgi:adsorption protein B
MWWVDVIATYLYALKFITIALAVLILISGLDDLIIDAVYWVRRAWRATTVYRIVIAAIR